MMRSDQDRARVARDEPGTTSRSGLTRRSALRGAALIAVAGSVSFAAARVTAPGAELPTWGSADMPSMAGRRAVVTGGNGYPAGGRSGLGFHVAVGLAAAGADVVIASRQRGRGEQAVRRIRAAVPDSVVRFEELDLADLDSIRAFVDRLGDVDGRLDVLVNNAGVQGRLRREVVADGTERVFATNARGPFALSAQLRPLLQRGEGARIVWTSSSRTGRIEFDDLQHERDYDYSKAYDDTKLAAQLMAFECQRRSGAAGWGITSIAVHPGVCRTNLVIDGPGLDSPEGLRFRYLPMLWQDPAVGALPALYAASAPGAAGGGYYGPRELRGLRGSPGFAIPSDDALDLRRAGRFWETMEAMTQLSFT